MVHPSLFAIAVGHVLHDTVRIHIIHDGGAACIADETVGALAHTVAFTGLGGYYFTGCGEAETFLATTFGFQLWHFPILLLELRSRAFALWCHNKVASNPQGNASPGDWGTDLIDAKPPHFKQKTASCELFSVILEIPEVCTI
jgi:hypothetical protein